MWEWAIYVYNTRVEIPVFEEGYMYKVRICGVMQYEREEKMECSQFEISSGCVDPPRCSKPVAHAIYNDDMTDDGFREAMR